ncbi:MAG TPA: hypothetical protein VMT55_01790, partial [Candidatus Sulfotelmatobacter sp.]|nr:hypothetical protein [Candidatus Sulfotelmatobacter sp.]
SDLLLPALTDAKALGASNVVIDTTAPVIGTIKIVDPNNPTAEVPLRNGQEVSLRVTVTEATSGMADTYPKISLRDKNNGTTWNMLNGAGMAQDITDHSLYVKLYDVNRNTPVGPCALEIVVQDKAGNVTTYDTTVQLQNSPPVITPIGDKSVSAGTATTINVYATDPDGQTVTYSLQGKPAAAAFASDGAGGYNFTWTPTLTDTDIGNHVLTFEASDGTATTAETINLVVQDTRSINTASSISGTLTNGWYKALPVITLTRNKTGTTYYQWNTTTAGGWTSSANASVVITGLEGKNTLNFYSVDQSDPANPVTETTRSTAQLKVDLQKPISALSVTPAIPASGWYNSAAYQNLVVKLTAADMPLVNGSGVNYLNYTLDGQPVNYNGTSRTIAFNGDGIHTIEAYWAEDLAGNQEVSNTTQTVIKIDTVVPVVTDGLRHSSSDPQSDVNTWYGANTGTFNIAISDATSGISSVELVALDRYSFPLGTFQLTNFTAPWRLPDTLWNALVDGKNTITVRAWDAAGNKNETVSFVVNKQTTGPGRPTG